jgi:hypothetical protein
VKNQNPSPVSVPRDAAVAAAAVILEEFFPHCTNGLVAPIGERLSEIVESAIEAVLAVRAIKQSEPSLN